MGGVGIDLSKIRPNGAKVNNAARSSTGIIPFLDSYSHRINEIAQNGRRGAAMVSLSVKHPDAMDFIKVKRDQTKITGANISLMTDDPMFMQLVDVYLSSGVDSTYIQSFPTDLDLKNVYSDVSKYREVMNFTEDGVLYETVNGNYLKFWKISELWNEFVKSNWMCADPGIIFKDWQDLYNPSHIYPGYKNVCTNPCKIETAA